jgi:hypothetical protein
MDLKLIAAILMIAAMPVFARLKADAATVTMQTRSSSKLSRRQGQDPDLLRYG